MARMYKIPNKLVKDIMSTNAVTAEVEDDLDKLMDMFERCGFQGYAVLDKDSKVVGIARDADVLRMFASYYPGAVFHSTVGDIMRSPPATVSPDDSMIDAMYAMRDSNTRFMPVVDKDNKLLGVLTRSDIIRGIETVDRYDPARETNNIKREKNLKKRRKRTGKD